MVLLQVQVQRQERQDQHHGHHQDGNYNHQALTGLLPGHGHLAHLLIGSVDVAQHLHLGNLAQSLFVLQDELQVQIQVLVFFGRVRLVPVVEIEGQVGIQEEFVVLLTGGTGHAQALHQYLVLLVILSSTVIGNLEQVHGALQNAVLIGGRDTLQILQGLLQIGL